MKKALQKGFFLALGVCFSLAFGLQVKAADVNNIEVPEWKLVENGEKTESFVAAYDVTDYGAVGDGETDNTEIFQKLLDKTGQLGGGIVYVPSGKYVIKGNLTIPKGVTLRGNWTKPIKGEAIDDGTILMAYAGRNGDETTAPFIEMAPETGVMELTIWYPEQDPDHIVPYSPTIRYGLDNYFGNEYCNTRNVTLVNSYLGVIFHYSNGGASPVVNGLYGTILKKGIQVDRIADVGRIEWVDFSPDYWSGSGLAGAPKKGDSFEDYMYENAVGIMMKRNDWSYTCYVNIEGCHVGYQTEVSEEGNGSTPNGHHYKFYFNDCETAVYVKETNYVGIMFSDVEIENCENGIVLGEDTSDIAQFYDTTIDVSKYAVKLPKTSTAELILNQSEIKRGRVAVNGGTFNVCDTDFNNSTPQMYIGTYGRVLANGCRYESEKKITNESIYESVINDTAVNSPEIAEYPVVKTESHTPKRQVLYNAAKAPYNVSTANEDNTEGIQAALDQASADGGGIVFIPSGKYKVKGHLVIPSDVELRGEVDLNTVPHGSGTILEAYENRDNETGDAFIQLKENAGIRGFVVDYPEQVFDGTESWMPAKYPYTIQGQGSDIYVMNIGLRAAYKGLDLFTYRCDDHYIDFLAGHVFDNGVRVGNDCEEGKIYNLMFNVIVYACGNESKFGSFSNMPNGVSNAPLYAYGLEHLDFLILGDCKNELLYNNFHYGSYRGTVLQNDGNGGPSGISMGLGVDGSTRAMYYTSGLTNEFDFINTQIVSIYSDTASEELKSERAYIYVEENSDFKSTFYNLDSWGQPVRSLVVGENAGDLHLIAAHFQSPGSETMAQVGNGSDVILMNSKVNQSGNGFVDAGSEANMSIIGTTANIRNNEEADFKEWTGNQSLAAAVSSEGSANSLDRDAWQASSSNNNGDAGNAIDGNIDTRWGTGGKQENGQWFQIDMQSPQTFNTIVLSVGASSGDEPKGYEVYVSSDGTDWGDAVASGTNGKIIQMETQMAQYIKIVQTGETDFGWWSIAELNVLNDKDGNDLYSDNDESDASKDEEGGNEGGNGSESGNEGGTSGGVLEQPEIYTVTYVLNGGSNSAANPASYQAQGQAIVLQAPARKGYTFAGWYADSSYTVKVSEIPADSTGDKNFYAKWTKVKVGKTTLKSVKPSGKKKVKLKIRKVSGAAGYQIKVCKDKKFKKQVKTYQVKNNKKTTITLKKLKSGKKYYVKIRAYKIDSTGSKVYGKYSKVKPVKVK